MAVYDIRNEYLRRFPEGQFFSDGAMDFFKSKVLSGFAEMKDGTIYFRTSEVGPDGRRYYHVRRMNNEGHIRLIGEFCEMTDGQAKRLYDKTVASHRASEIEEERNA